MFNNIFPESHPKRRLDKYDYSSPGLYFVTICTKYRIQHFGHLKDAKIHLSDIGKIVEQCWIEIPQHCLNTKIHEFIVMPDHIHGIIEILPNVGADHDQRLRD